MANGLRREWVLAVVIAAWLASGAMARANPPRPRPTQIRSAASLLADAAARHASPGQAASEVAAIHQWAYAVGSNLCATPTNDGTFVLCQGVALMEPFDPAAVRKAPDARERIAHLHAAVTAHRSAFALARSPPAGEGAVGLAWCQLQLGALSEAHALYLSAWHALVARLRVGTHIDPGDEAHIRATSAGLKATFSAGDPKETQALENDLAALGRMSHVVW